MKYRNTKTVVDGRTFDSKAEARRFSELLLLAKAGRITGLEVQPVFVLAPPVKYEDGSRKKPELRYVADFAYVENGIRVVEDVKGVETPAFKIKRHLLKWLHQIDVRIFK